jgi:hypothetical protein
VGDPNGAIIVGANFVTVGQLSLPAGNYVVWASLYAVNSGSPGILACELVVNSRNAQATTSMAPFTAATQALTVADTLPNPVTIVLQCHDNVLAGTVSIQTFNLTAIRTGTLTIGSS